jgi:type IV pilus assembly protein PilC
MALAISAGLDTFESLKMVSNLVENKKTEEKIDVCRQVLLNGDSLADGLKEASIFSNVNNRMVAVGIKTGDIEQVLNKIADGYQRANEKKINNIISVIEPTLVIVLSLVVGLILLSVILPLMGIMTTIG